MRVLLPPALIRLFPGCPPELDLHGETIAAVLDALDHQYPGMRDRLCDSTPALRRHINIFIAGERATLATRPPPGSEILVMTAISGG